MIIVANWKMYLDLDLSIANSARYLSLLSLHKIIIAPSIPYLALLSRLFPSISFASQDCDYTQNEYGPHTGSFSPAVIASIGVKYAIVGHIESRRKNILNTGCLESAILEQTRKKILILIKNNIIPIVCLSKPVEVLDTLQNIVAEEVIVAYEPEYSVNCSSLDIDRIASDLQELFQITKRELYHIKKLYIIYGGSVNKENFEHIVEIGILSGVLLGVSSIDFEHLSEIVSHKVL